MGVCKAPGKPRDLLPVAVRKHGDERTEVAEEKEDEVQVRARGGGNRRKGADS